MSMVTLTALALVATGMTRMYAGRWTRRRELHCRHTHDPSCAGERRPRTGRVVARRRPAHHHLRRGRRAFCR
jgi:hypothetical protein